MLAEIIISMLLPGAVAGPAGIAAEPDDQDPPVRVSLDENGDYYPGHFAQVDVRTDFDGFLLVLHLDPAGQLRVLFPLEPYDDGFVEVKPKFRKFQIFRRSAHVSGNIVHGNRPARKLHVRFLFQIYAR